MHYSTLLAIVIVLAAGLTIALIILSTPLLKSHVLARPDHRSSHREPTPQGAGAAVVLSTFLVVWFALTLNGSLSHEDSMPLLALTGACALLAAVGAIDDIRGLSPLLRLAAQFIAVGIVVGSVPDVQLVPGIPFWLERALIILGGVWFVNLVNFMDGIDWMTVAEIVPITGAIILIGWIGLLAPLPLLVASALLGSIIGFAPFNKPVARLFLGDVGSLPIGLVLGWLLLLVASHGQAAAAILLPLYYLADATLTLLLRFWRGERVWHPHRFHFYQRAVDRGLKVPTIVGRVFLTNLALCGLALICVAANEVAVSVASLGAGAAIVGLLLATLVRGSKQRA